MERLTKRNKNGQAVIAGIDQSEFNIWIDELEDADVVKIGKAVKKLAEYEDQEEKGLLLHTPIAVGQTVYEIIQDYDSKKEYTRKDIVLEVSNERIWGDITCWDYDDIGKTLFLSEKEAEEKIKENEEIRNRLTWEKDGEWGLKKYNIKNVDPEVYEALYRLHKYEKTGLSPEKVMELSGITETEEKQVSENTDHPCVSSSADAAGAEDAAGSGERAEKEKIEEVEEDAAGQADMESEDTENWNRLNRRIRYRPKIVEGRITGTGWPIDEKILFLSLWNCDNHKYWHLFGWEEETDQAVMETVFLTETKAKICLYDTLEEFKAYWKKREWEPGGSFCIPLENVEVVKVIQEEQKEVSEGKAEVREEMAKNTSEREAWIKQHTCDFCMGKHMHTCTSYSCDVPKKKAAEHYDKTIKKVLT